MKRRTGLTISLPGLTLLVACGLVAVSGRVSPVERTVFSAVNRLPGWLYSRCGSSSSWPAPPSPPWRPRSSHSERP